jgi:hypothetical protein
MSDLEIQDDSSDQLNDKFNTAILDKYNDESYGKLCERADFYGMDSLTEDEQYVVDCFVDYKNAMNSAKEKHDMKNNGKDSVQPDVAADNDAPENMMNLKVQDVGLSANVLERSDKSGKLNHFDIPSDFAEGFNKDEAGHAAYSAQESDKVISKIPNSIEIPPDFAAKLDDDVYRRRHESDKSSDYNTSRNESYARAALSEIDMPDSEADDFSLDDNFK